MVRRWVAMVGCALVLVAARPRGKPPPPIGFFGILGTLAHPQTSAAWDELIYPSRAMPTATIDGHEFGVRVMGCSGRTIRVAYSHRIEGCPHGSENGAGVADAMRRQLVGEGWRMVGTHPVVHQYSASEEEAMASEHCQCTRCGETEVVMDGLCIDRTDPVFPARMLLDNCPDALMWYVRSAVAASTECTCAEPYEQETWVHPHRQGQVRELDPRWGRLVHRYATAPTWCNPLPGGVTVPDWRDALGVPPEGRGGPAFLR